jgi:hypothetical protein
MSDAINPSLTKVLLQTGGNANPFQFLPRETDVDAISGGGVTVESDFAGREYVGSRQTSNPARWTGNLSSRRTTVSKLRNLASDGLPCFHNLVILNGCESQDFTKFSMGEKYVDFTFSGLTPSDMIAKKTDQADPRLMDAIAVDAAIRIEFHPLAHTLQGTAFGDAGINHIINIKNPRCSGRCGDYDAGDREFIAVADPISPATAPRIGYTGDGGNTWTIGNIAAVANGVAQWVAVHGNNVIIAASGTDAGLYRAPLDGVKAGTATFTPVTGAPAAAFNCVMSIESLVVAVGASGNLYISRDGGYSVTQLASGVSSTLNAIAGDSESLFFIGGASGVVRKVVNGRVVSGVTVTGLSTDNVTALAVPANRTNELYVGSVAGKIYRTKNAGDALPVWKELSFDKPSGGGIIEHMAFSDAMGSFFWVVQTNGSSQSRVLIDYSGGDMASAAVAIGSFTSPGNAIINAIAPANADYALTVGEPVNSNGFTGVIFGGE